MSETTAPRVMPAVALAKTVTDSLGRVLTIRKLDALAELDLIEAAGTNADNRPWMTRATLAACVTDIHGIPSAMPTTRLAIRSKSLSAIIFIFDRAYGPST